MNPGLTSFRAFAFIAVFLFHIGLLRSGYLGVQAFFVLSGFLLTPILVEMKKNLSPRDYFLGFYGRRALRIFPLYYCYLLATVLVSLVALNFVGEQPALRFSRFLEQLPWSLTFTYNFYHSSNTFEHTHLVTHFWSLAIEEQFYLIWPLILMLIPVGYLKRFLLFTLIMGPVIRGLLAFVISEDKIPGINERLDMVIYVLPFSHIDAFAIGGFFALYAKGSNGNMTWFAIMLVLLFGFLTEYFFANNGLHLRNLGFAPFMADSYKYVWGYSLLNALFAYLLIQIRDRKFLTRLFESRAIVYLGKISYGLYVFHFPVIFYVHQLLPVKSVMILGPVSFLVTVLVSALSYEFMERRFIDLKDVYFDKRKVNV